MTRFAVALFLCLSFLSGATPSGASAHGPALKGRLLTHSVSFQGTTGNCTCNAQWFTMGLNPGTAKATLRLGACQGAPAGGVCSTEVFLMQGENEVARVIASCFASKKVCNLTKSLSYRVTRRGAYYLLVQGVGAFAIHYTLSLKAPIYPLHCHGKYC